LRQNLIGGTIGGTALTLVFLPALYAIWYRIKPPREMRAQDHVANRHVASAAALQPVS
jgi:hypothetical protein